jgi:nitrite reductase/ring-hydroxylating ferredoxin subunit
MKHALFPLEELAPGEMRAVEVAGDQVVVIRDRDGQVHALRDRCPHSGAPLSRGRLVAKVVGGDVDEYELTSELVVRCPWHGFEFEPATGRCLADPRRTRVRPYRVTIEEGTICVERGSLAAAE